MKLKPMFSLIKDSFSHWKSHRASRMGAALSYYTVFSILPLLSLIVIIVGPLLDQSSLQSEIVNQVHGIVGRQGADFVQSILTGVTDVRFDVTTILISIGTLIAGMLGVLYELKNAMDDLWDVDSTVTGMSGWKYFLSSRLLALSVVPILGFLFLISLVWSALLTFIAGFSPALASMTHLLQAAALLFSFLTTLFLFTFIYRYLPNRKLPWKELFRGATVTAILFMLGRFVINYYIAEFTATSVFGAAGAFVVLLLWIYYSTQIFLFGASLTYVYSKQYGKLKKA